MAAATATLGADLDPATRRSLTAGANAAAWSLPVLVVLSPVTGVLGDLLMLSPPVSTLLVTAPVPAFGAVAWRSGPPSSRSPCRWPSSRG